jgi:hypothetical protein
MSTSQLTTFNECSAIKGKLECERLIENSLIEESQFIDTVQCSPEIFSFMEAMNFKIPLLEEIISSYHFNFDQNSYA